MPEPSSENDAAARTRPPSNEADPGDDLAPPFSEASIVKLVAAHQVVVGVLGLAVMTGSVGRIPQTLAYGAETGQLTVVLLNGPSCSPSWAHSPLPSLEGSRLGGSDPVGSLGCFLSC
jgi:hypothetical protein